MNLVTRTHSEQGRESSAVYSPCDNYRYALTRIWNTTEQRITYVMLNPSKATELANDPTVERCERRARRLGYGAMRVCNIFAWRDTDPARLKRAKSPIGPANEAVLIEAANWADHVLCAWGVHGAHLNQGPKVGRMLVASGKPLFSLGVTKGSHPRHPLYVGYATALAPWSPSEPQSQ